MTHLVRNRPVAARALVAGITSIALMSLVGCGGSEKGDELTDVKLIVSGKLTVCTDIPYEPFEFKNEDGQPTGFDVELVQQMADDLDADLDVIDVAFDEIVSGQSLNTDVCDVAITAMSIDGARARVVDFSSPYFDAKQALVVPRGSGLDELSELAGKTVGVQKGTKGEIYAKDFAPPSAKIATYDSVPELEEALKNAEVAGILLDNAVSRGFVSKNRALKVAREFDTGEQYGMAVKKDGNIPLLRHINSALAEFKKNGGYDKLYKKYFG